MLNVNNCGEGDREWLRYDIEELTSINYALDMKSLIYPSEIAKTRRAIQNVQEKNRKLEREISQLKAKLYGPIPYSERF